MGESGKPPIESLPRNIKGRLEELLALTMELEKSHEAAQTLTEIGTLLDSIDETRQLLRVNLVEGTPYDDYSGRMRELNDYIATTESRIDELEESLKTSKANARAFSKTIAQLKSELKKKSQEMAFLQEQVEKFRNHSAPPAACPSTSANRP